MCYWINECNLLASGAWQMQSPINYKKVCGLELHLEHLFLFAFLWRMCEATSNLFCNSHFAFLFFHFLNHPPLFCGNLMKVAKVGENEGFQICRFVVTTNSQQCFWSLILEFRCSLCFIVSLVLHLVASFVWRCICEVARGKYFLLSVVVVFVYLYLFHQLSPSHKIKLYFFSQLIPRSSKRYTWSKRLGKRGHLYLHLQYLSFLFYFK